MGKGKRFFVFGFHRFDQLQGELFVRVGLGARRECRRFHFSREEEHSQREQGRVGVRRVFVHIGLPFL